jgi:large subunit ribosomal protein L21
MFAVIKTGGKQYKVAMNDVILVEKLEVAAGDDVTFNEILMVGQDSNLTVGAPLVKGASVSAKVLDQAQADKVLIFKKNRRHNYRRKRGHRQLQTVLRITDIKAA